MEENHTLLSFSVPYVDPASDAHLQQILRRNRRLALDRVRRNDPTLMRVEMFRASVDEDFIAELASALFHNTNLRYLELRVNVDGPGSRASTIYARAIRWTYIAWNFTTQPLVLQSTTVQRSRRRCCGAILSSLKIAVVGAST
jgi:hypothetical protein